MTGTCRPVGTCRPGGRRLASTLQVVAAALVVGAGAIEGAPAAASGARQWSGAHRDQSGPAASVVASGQSDAAAMHGPERFSAVLPTTSRRGDLLIAAVVCGVVGNGTAVPTLRLPGGWHEAVRRVGGFEGGLESALYFYPSNPGGLRRFSVGSVPRGTDAYCTTFTAELRGIGAGVHLEATGSGQSWGTAVAARTPTAVSRSRTVVLLVSTDGTEEHHTHYTIPSGFRPIEEQTDGRRYQPGTFSIRFGTSTGPQGGVVTWQGAMTDGCAVVAAFHA